MVQVVVLSLAFAGIASSALAQPLKSPLTELEKQYEEAINARDAAKLAAFYAEEATFMPADSPPMTGRSVIQREHEQVFRDVPAFKMAVRPLASETTGDLGYSQGEYVLRAESAKDGSGEIRQKYLRVWKRVNGEWKIQYDIYNSNERPAPPKPPNPPMPPTPPQ